MKKFTLIAAAAAVAMSASAQYNTDKLGTAAFLGEQKGHLDYIVLNPDMEAILNGDKAFTMQYVGPNGEGEGRTLDVWPMGETLAAGDKNMPGVDGGFEYMSLTQVPTQTWAGGGYNISDKAPANFSHFTDETVFHCAYACQTGSISGMYMTVLNSNNISLGTSVDGAVVVAKAPADEWQAFAITLGELKKEIAGFETGNLASWTGNIVAFGGDPNGGWAAGANLSLDAVYFFTPGGSDAIETVETNAAQLVVSNRTISSLGAEGIALYNLNGQLVKSVAGTVMGLDNVATGVYVAKAGNSVVKVSVK